MPREGFALVLLAVVLGWAVARPRGWPEAIAAVPAAALAVAAGVVGRSAAVDELRRLVPVVGFLAAVLVLAEMCAEEGLFAAVGAAMARWSRRSSHRLLAAVFAAAAVTTAVLSLDTTVVMLTPVVVATVLRTGVEPRPHLFACTHLANSASLLLPVSNLTNLIALAVVPLSFSRFAALMALPWLAVLAVEWVVLRRTFAGELGVVPATSPAARPPWPRFALVVVAATLVGFTLSSVMGVGPVWVAAAGAAVLVARRLARRRTSARRVGRAAAVPFLVFVLALGVVVRGVVDSGLGRSVDSLLPHGTSLPALLGVAALAAVLANVVNNLPAVLVLAPAAAAIGVPAVLAVLIGVNAGPNLTYQGSLATLLWRRVLHRHGHATSIGHFTWVGLLTVPPVIVTAVVALWCAVSVLGTGGSAG